MEGIVRKLAGAFVIVVVLALTASFVTGCGSKGVSKATYTCYYSDGATSTTTRIGDGTLGPECR